MRRVHPPKRQCLRQFLTEQLKKAGYCHCISSFHIEQLEMLWFALASMGSLSSVSTVSQMDLLTMFRDLFEALGCELTWMTFAIHICVM